METQATETLQKVCAELHGKLVNSDGFPTLQGLLEILLDLKTRVTAVEQALLALDAYLLLLLQQADIHGTMEERLSHLN